MARGYYDLAKVITEQYGDQIKAEMLARESLRIRERLYSLCLHDNHFLIESISCLAKILLRQGKLGNETKVLSSMN